MLPAETSDEQLDRLAERIVELLSLRFPAEGSVQFVDARAIAAEFGISRKWVYEHADALGAIRVGSGRKQRLRFDRAVVRERIATVGSLPDPAAPRRSRQRATTPAGDGLLPIRGRRAAK